ncbi:FmdE family protein [Thermosulfuriphilus sp.]
MIWVPLELKVLAEKIGLLCPEVAIGWRVGDYFRRRLVAWGEKIKEHRIVSYNTSKSAETLCLMGFRLQIEDLGEHVYSLCRSDGSPRLMISIRLRHLLPEVGFRELEEKIINLQAGPEERQKYLLALDRWVSQIILASDQELFKKEGGQEYSPYQGGELNP